MITIKNLTKKYGNRVLFKNFDFNFPEKGVVAIVGESGKGKSTLLNLISGLDKNYEGQIKIDEIDLKNKSEKETCDYRLSNIGYVFQNFNLLNLDTAYQNVILPLNSVSCAPNKIKKRRANDLFKLLNISYLKNRQTNKLSGGEKQRIAIARALINEPKVVLCDEPTGALDEKNSELIFSLLKTISSETLIVIATHDLKSVKKIANIILEIRNESIIIKELKTKKAAKYPPLISCGKKAKKVSVPTLFKFSHSYQKNKAKKWRSLFINLMLSFSLTGVGLSLIIKDSVSNKINEAFKELLNGNQIVMTNKKQNPNTFTATYSVSKEKIESIAEKYDEFVDGIGVNYLVKFEEFFKDENSVTLLSDFRSLKIPEFSARNINDFRLIGNAKNLVFYPSINNKLNDDEIVLGIPYELMANICYNFKVQRSYSSLGHLIYENGLQLFFSFRNNYWEYDDQQLFNVVGICECTKPTFFHSNLRWNEEVFENMMRLPSDDDDEHFYPWEMQKIYYLNTKEDPQKFLDNAFYDEELKDIIFERTNYEYNPVLCEYDKTCNENRLYAYSVDKTGIDPCEINKIKKLCPDINNYYFLSNFGYSSYGANLFSGFSKNVFVSLKQTLIDDAIDADTSVKDETNFSINLPDGVIQGNYLNSLGGGLRFSTNQSNLIYGRETRNSSEIVISKGLAESLNFEQDIIGRYLIFAAVVNETQDANGNLEKSYNSVRLSIVGVTNETKNYVYNDNTWTISFFRDLLGISNFLLIPTGVIFEFNENFNTERYVDLLNKTFKQYNFSSPLVELNKNIQDTLNYANTILVGFSTLATLISILLLSTIIFLNIIENRNEVQILHTLGIKNKDINSIFVCGALLQGIIAFFVSALELIGIDQFISLALGDYLGIGFKFSLNLKPILAIFVLAIFIPFFLAKIIIFLLGNKGKHKKY